MVRSARFPITRLVLALPVLLIGVSVAAQSVKLEGLIKSRNGDTMSLQGRDSENVTVLLTDNTEVGQVQGVLKARRKEMSMAALIPGLAVKIEGRYNDRNQLVATSVSFKGNDLQRAESIQAGMHEVKVQGQENTAELEKQNAKLVAQNEELKGQQAAIDAAVARFGQLDDYYILDEVTVYFDNGKAKVDPKYVPQLLSLAEKAKSTNGFMIEVKGYTSSVGSTALNQQLSEDRAGEVTNILVQQSHIPLTRMLAPGAMGETHQVGDDKTEKGQAENRRVVVRVLQNKGIAGTA